MTLGDSMTAWIMRMFGSMEAWKRSLPTSRWVQGENGWYSATR